MRTNLKRELTINPAYDKRKEGYGQHCAEMRWMVTGEKGAVQFLLFTGWFPNIIPALGTVSWDKMNVSREYNPLDRPMPADIGYHSLVPMYEGQTEMECHYLPSGKCYYDGSSLGANEYFSILVHQGGEALWEALEKYYEERFESGEIHKQTAL